MIDEMVEAIEEKAKSILDKSNVVYSEIIGWTFVKTIGGDFILNVTYTIYQDSPFSISILFPRDNRENYTFIHT